ncbi:hypothetical protein GIB67_021032 [Kingdonia uniflora]|uniref:Uncharacterized protein n=1 Tax=Kingdonia uniflora TaxID=39325 RepID=A0A7J7N725_9MAGN|nr:hypothetical protein GIB67_021032 [Kingdonia uniflora]
MPLKKKVEGTKIEALTDEQLDHVSLVLVKTLIPKIPNKGLEGLEVVKYLTVQNKVEVERKVNLEAIFSEYGGNRLETSVICLDVFIIILSKTLICYEVFVHLLYVKWKKGDEIDDEDKKDDDDEKDGEEKAPSDEEEQPQVAEEEKIQKTSVDQTTAVSGKEQTMEVAKIEVAFSHQEEDVNEANQTSVDQTAGLSVEEQSKEEVVEGKDNNNGTSLKKPDPVKIIKDMVVDQTNV